MTTDQQKLTLQTQDQQSQQQQEYKTIKELNGPLNTIGRNAAPSSPTSCSHKSNIHEMPNHDFVNRLMTATPAYFYSTPVGPNNFIFSDMLRSLVTARSNESLRNFQLQQTAALAKRSRKRTWSQQQQQQQHQQQQYRTQFKENDCVKTNCESPQSQLLNTFVNEKPLELTTTATNKTFQQFSHNNNNNNNNSSSNENKYCAIKLDDKAKYHDNIIEATSNPNETNKYKMGTGESCINTVENDRQLVVATTSTIISTTATTTSTSSSPPPPPITTVTAATTSTSLPPPPIWYPSIYPPYGIDPLHFFIDLRVSSHIYDRDRDRDHDRKKDHAIPLTNVDKNETANVKEKTRNISMSTKGRHGSAFTVPIPRSLNMKKCIPLTPLTHDAINLSLSATNMTMANTNGNLLRENLSYDLSESKENLRTTTNSNTNYMIQQHLPRIYGRDLLFNQTSGGQMCDIMNSNQENDNKSDQDCEDDSDGRTSIDNYTEIDLTANLSNNNDNIITNDNINNNNHINERDIDVEIIDCIKYRTDGESSHCSSTDDLSTFI